MRSPVLMTMTMATMAIVILFIVAACGGDDDSRDDLQRAVTILAVQEIDENGDLVAVQGAEAAHVLELGINAD